MAHLNVEIINDLLKNNFYDASVMEAFHSIYLDIVTGKMGRENLPPLAGFELTRWISKFISNIQCYDYDTGTLAVTLRQSDSDLTYAPMNYKGDHTFVLKEISSRPEYDEPQLQPHLWVRLNSLREHIPNFVFLYGQVVMYALNAEFTSNSHPVEYSVTEYVPTNTVERDGYFGPGPESIQYLTDVDEYLFALLQVASALKLAEEHNIHFNDLNPDDILIRRPSYDKVRIWYNGEYYTGPPIIAAINTVPSETKPSVSQLNLLIYVSIYPYENRLKEMTAIRDALYILLKIDGSLHAFLLNEEIIMSDIIDEVGARYLTKNTYEPPSPLMDLNDTIAKMRSEPSVASIQPASSKINIFNMTEQNMELTRRKEIQGIMESKLSEHKFRSYADMRQARKEVESKLVPSDRLKWSIDQYIKAGGTKPGSKTGSTYVPKTGSTYVPKLKK